MYKILIAGIASMVIFPSTFAQLNYGIADPFIPQIDGNPGFAPDQHLNRQDQEKFIMPGIKSTGNQPAFQRDSILGYDHIPGKGPVLFHKQFWEYDKSGNIILYVYSEWDTDNGAWKNNQKQEYVRDSRGNVTLRTSYNWDEHNEAWKNHHKS